MRLIRHYQQLQANSTSSVQNYTISNSTKVVEVQSQQSSGGFPLYAIILILVAFFTIVFIIICCYLQKRTRDKYQTKPENFSRKPELGFFQKFGYKRSDIKTPLGDIYPQANKIKTYEGELYEVEFNSKDKVVYFDRKLKKDCYFQVEILEQPTYIKIGFIPVKYIKDLQNKKIQLDEDEQLDIGQEGVSLNQEGEIFAYGQKKFSCDWSLKFGDVIGIGFTQHKSNVRVWITKNGLLINQPTEEEMLKNIDLDQQAVQEQKGKILSVEEQEKQRQQILKQLKRKIELKKVDKFQYYAVVSTTDQSARGVKINWNVGAHIFRLYDGNTLKGLLN